MRIFACFLILAFLASTGCKGTGKKDKDKTAAQSKKEDAPAEQISDQDFQAFVGRLRKAVQSRDVNAIAAMMTPDFAFVMGNSPDADKKGEGVFQYWEENGLWPELEGIMSETFVKKEEFMVAPPQFGNSAIQYDGYRAGMRRVNGSWKFAYFVNG